MYLYLFWDPLATKEAIHSSFAFKVQTAVQKPEYAGWTKCACITFKEKQLTSCSKREVNQAKMTLAIWNMDPHGTFDAEYIKNAKSHAHDRSQTHNYEPRLQKDQKRTW